MRGKDRRGGLGWGPQKGDGKKDLGGTARGKLGGPSIAEVLSVHLPHDLGVWTQLSLFPPCTVLIRMATLTNSL